MLEFAQLLRAGRQAELPYGTERQDRLRRNWQKGRIVIDPLSQDDIQPASVDLRLDRKLLVFTHSRRPHIDVKKGLDDLTEIIEIDDETPFILHPGEFVLGSTLEHIELPRRLWWRGWRARAAWAASGW